MDIAEMHVWFRQYAQQMGMQNVRAILPEQIDILINTSITDTVNDIIRRNIGITNDRYITDNSKVGQINALRFLYKVKNLSFISKKYQYDVSRKTTFDSDFSFNKFYINIEYNNNNHRDVISNEFDIDFEYDTIESVTEKITNFLEEKSFDNVSFTTDVDFISRILTADIEYSTSLSFITTFKIDSIDFGVINTETSDPGIPFSKRTLIIVEGDDITYSSIDTPNFIFKNENYYNGLVSYKNKLDDYLFLVDFSIDYSSCNEGFNESDTPVYNNNFKTNLFPIRLIDDSYLADTLNDFVLKPRLRSPIMVIYDNQMDIYLGKLQKIKVSNKNFYTLENNLVPNNVRMSYIAKPAIVKYTEDINGTNVDCDLPEYMHIDILKHAVDLYNISISGSLQSAQAREQQQARENIRNNARQEEQ